MKRIICLLTLILISLSAISQEMRAEDYYVSAFNSMADMLADKDTLSIKRAVFLAEWAYLEGKLDYEKDFCPIPVTDILRIPTTSSISPRRSRIGKDSLSPEC